jgi:hypothetical protein
MDDRWTIVHGLWSMKERMMKANGSSLQLFYLRWAGLVSAVLGLVSFFIVLLAYRESNLVPKLALGLIGLIGAAVSYAIGKDVVDRVRNHEPSSEFLTSGQARLGYVGTRFGFSFTQLILLIASASIVVFSVPVIERVAFFCSDPEALKQCAHHLLGMNFTD